MAALLPEAPEGDTGTTSTTTPMPWPKFFAMLYGYATGWLGWTPETAWQATPQEITDAFSAHIAALMAVHGGNDDAEQNTTSPTEEQHQHIIDQGFDPKFDRAGLRALKGLGKI